MLLLHMLGLSLVVYLSEVQTFVYSGQEGHVELADVLFISDLHWSSSTISDGIQHRSWVCVLLVALSDLAE